MGPDSGMVHGVGYDAPQPQSELAALRALLHQQQLQISELSHMVQRCVDAQQQTHRLVLDLHERTGALVASHRDLADTVRRPGSGSAHIARGAASNDGCSVSGLSASIASVRLATWDPWAARHEPPPAAAALRDPVRPTSSRESEPSRPASGDFRAPLRAAPHERLQQEPRQQERGEPDLPQQDMEQPRRSDSDIDDPEVRRGGQGTRRLRKHRPPPVPEGSTDTSLPAHDPNTLVVETPPSSTDVSVLPPPQPPVPSPAPPAAAPPVVAAPQPAPPTTYTSSSTPTVPPPPPSGLEDTDTFRPASGGSGRGRQHAAPAYVAPAAASPDTTLNTSNDGYCSYDSRQYLRSIGLL